MTEFSRKTKETDISVVMDMNAPGPSSPETTLPFFDHMLNAMAFHGGFRMEIKAGAMLKWIPTTLWRIPVW